jgi:hypothetical protein
MSPLNIQKLVSAVQKSNEATLPIIGYVLKPYLDSSRKGFIESDVAFGALLCCLDIDSLMEEKLFQELAKRYKRSNSHG